MKSGHFYCHLLQGRGLVLGFLGFNLVEALSHPNFFNVLLYLPVQVVTGVLFLYCYNLCIKAI